MLGAVSLGYPTLKRVVLPSAFPALGQIATGSRAGARTVRVTISPASSGVPPTVTVEIDPGTGFVKVMDAFSLAGNGPVPAAFKMGFTARTGGETNIHEVRVRRATTLVSAVPALGESAPLGALVALLALLTLPALRWRLHS
jgi:type IV pilus assembly protein PilY1